MQSTISLQIQPADVLGVSPDASLEQIRDAYRAKAKRHHPDVGGEEWAFRLVSQAYEMLSTARVVFATEREATAPSRRAHVHTPTSPSNGHVHHAATATQPPPTQTGRRFGTDGESVRRGVHESAVDLTKVVDVEKLSIRYQSEGIWLITDRSNEDRFLSCCLNVTWPSPGLSVPPALIESTEKVLRELGQVFDAVDVHSKATTSSASVVDNRFSGWLSYPTGEAASAAFEQLREKLHGVGMAVNQWSRDLVIPRQWR